MTNTFKLEDWGIPGLTDEERDRFVAVLEEARRDDFTLPRLNLSPIDPIDEAAQAWPGKTDSEIAAMQATDQQATDQRNRKPRPTVS